MKVFQVLNHFLPHQTAGTEVYTWALSKHLQNNNVKVQVINPNYGQENSAAYIYDGIKVFQFAEPSIVDRSLMLGYRKADGLAAFAKYLEKEKPDIVNFHEITGSNGITLQHVIAAKKAGAKIVITLHVVSYSCNTGNLLYKGKTFCEGKIDILKCTRCTFHEKGIAPFNPFLNLASVALYKLGIDSRKWGNRFGTALGTAFRIYFLKKRLETLVEYCDKVIVITEWYKKIMLINNVPQEKITFIPQGLPFKSLDKYYFKEQPFSYPLRLIFLGRISNLKGLHLLLEALADLPNNKIELEIFGQSENNEYEKELRYKTKDYNNIHWNGKLLQKDVIRTIQQFDAICLCSTISEMSPLVIQEAFAANVPVIASNVRGNAEQIKHGYNGLLFSSKDAASLKIQLLACINNPRLLQKLKNNIAPPRSFESVGDEYLDLFKKMI